MTDIPSPLRLDVADDGIATMTLSRADKHNALSPELMDALSDAATKLGEDEAVRVVVLAADGPTFCAGGDLTWMQAQMRADRPQRMAEARRLADMLSTLNAMPVPLVAKVQGNAFGGGVGMMAVCDHVIASDTATFGFTETRLGIIPATIGPHVIARIGEGRARRVIMSSRLFGVAEARDLGLVERAVTSSELIAAVAETAEPYLATSRSAVAMAKRLARTLGSSATEDAIAHSIEQLADAWETPDAQSRITAFLKSRAQT